MSSTSLLAQDAPPTVKPVRFLADIALELGGDEVAEVYFTNGNTQSVRAGQGGSLGVGAQFQFKGVEKLLLQSTIGIKYVTTEADNAHIRLTRIPVQLAAHWFVAQKFRIGAGVVTHRSIRFKTDGIGGDMKFNSATGPLFEIGYGAVGMRYTAMNYKDEFSRKYAANAIGIAFSLAFPGNHQVFGKKR